VDRDFLEDLSTLFGGEAVADLKEFAAIVHLDSDRASLKQEYMDLFAVPTSRYVTPFEDVYRGKVLEGRRERGPLMGEGAIAARRIYRQAGAEMDRLCMELPTHIGVELFFMGFLCEREAESIRNGEGDALQDREERGTTEVLGYRKLQIRFLQKHLNAWFPQLSQSIQRNTKSQFYRGMALITQAFLVQDTANLVAQSHAETLDGVKDAQRPPGEMG
jgi:TorA maturation chaperone TorD